MSGYTNGAQTEIIALRPAPIQVSWIDYLSTSGATFMDYFITNNTCFPPELQNVYTEHNWLLQIILFLLLTTNKSFLIYDNTYVFKINWIIFQLTGKC